MIPLSVPNLSKLEKDLVTDCMKTGWVSTAGKYVAQFEEDFSKKISSKYCVSTVNGTSAIHISLLASNLQDNEHVITTNLTFVATLNAIAYTKATPLLFDVDLNDWQLDLNLLEDFLMTECYRDNNNTFYKRTKKRIHSVLIVHNNGNMCDMDRLARLCKEFNMILIEDAAESLGSTYKKRHSGTIGDYGIFSFNGNKIITTGGGGMLTAKKKLNFKKAQHLATTAKKNPDTYFHDEVGYNYRLVNVLAAIGVGQLKSLNQFVKKKQYITKRYIKNFQDIDGFKAQKIQKNVSSNNWLATFIFEDSKGLMKYLESKKIQTRPFWYPMNQLPMHRKLEYISNSDNSGSIHKNALSLPCSTSITKEQIDYVIEQVRNFYK